MSRPQKVDLQRCFLHGNVPRGVEDAAPYKWKCRFFDKLSGPSLRRGRLYFTQYCTPQRSKLH